MVRYIDGLSIDEWNNAKYRRDHNRVYKKHGKARDRTCVRCVDKAHDWAHIHDTDETNPDNYQAMCRFCHQDYDRAEWLIEERKRDAARKANTNAGKGWTPERREAQRQRMLDQWADPEKRKIQAERAKRDKPWTGRRPKSGGGAG